MTYWHYTCAHGAARIDRDGGILRPNRHPFLAGLSLTWFTTIRNSQRSWLGLTSHTLTCDRMERVYEVHADDEALVMPWTEVRSLPMLDPYRDAILRLEGARGTRPALWAVAVEPVRTIPPLH